MKLDQVEGGPRRIRAQRRRLWSVEEKRKIVAETMEPGALMAEVARRHNLTPNLLFTWRRQARGKTMVNGAGSVELVPVVVTPESAPASRMEIVLAGGERILVGADVDVSALARIVKALRLR